MTQFWRYIQPVAVTGALVVATIGACRAQVVITPGVSVVSGLYQYRYAITNTSPTDDLFDISFHVMPTPDAVQNIVTPIGFKSAFDPGLGLVDFVEDSSFFNTGIPVSGFGFTSKFSPGNGLVDSNFLSASTANIFTITSRTLTPTGAVPEPGAWAFLSAAIAVSGVCFARSRHGRRRCTAI